MKNQDFDTLVDNLRKKGLSYSDIFSLTKKEDNDSIPISRLSNRKLGMLEAAVVYLKDERDLTYHQIAVLLKRDDRTIWTSYKKAKEKLK